MQNDCNFIDIALGGRTFTIEYQWINQPEGNYPLIVFLHEGLGSVAMWKSFPEELCSQLGARGLVFSRPGYGQSSERCDDEAWTASFMHQQAYEALPELLSRLDVYQDNSPLFLFGHSDGGSIALLFAAQYADCIDGLIVMAPHLFVEPKSIDSIEKARQAYLQTNLKEKLARYHKKPDSAFWGWNDIWLHPEFRNWNIETEMQSITKPVLAMQGIEDEYGTMRHVHRLGELLVDCTVVEIPDCGHSPHRDQPLTVTNETLKFVSRLTSGI
jgi:pimeloyl-ACP methyl ester carboxylesterase